MLYDECLRLAKAPSPPAVFQNSETNALASLSPISTLPSLLEFNETALSECSPVYYISDLHLEHQIANKFPAGATEKQVERYLQTIVRNLFPEAFLEDIAHNLSPIVLFAGDICASFKLAELFYTKFISHWDKLERDFHRTRRKQFIPIQQELDSLWAQIAELEQSVSEWSSHHGWTKRATKPLDQYGSVPPEIRQASSTLSTLKEQASSLRSQLPDDLYWNSPFKKHFHFVYAILGNHELWDFNNLDDCIRSYQDLFQKLEICFLHNNIAWFGKTNGIFCNDYTHHPQLLIEDSAVDNDSAIDDDSHYYSHIFQSVMIVGGIGFAGCNSKFNAINGIYQNALSRQEEIEQSNLWHSTYLSALASAKAQNKLLIVLTHNPISDWQATPAFLSNCIYFSGHTHKNLFQAEPNQNFYCYADNQIGYHGTHFHLKRTSIYRNRNPFADYPDGCYEISSTDYLAFYNYMCEPIAGNGRVEYQLKQGNSHFYMIKSEGYYGFFLTSKSGTCICAGGRLKKISKSSDIRYFQLNFSNMIRSYWNALSPYRKAQEEISNYVKRFGGTGTIHGCIIDIDFYCHIFLSPEDGEITYYYSPFYGYIDAYPNLLELMQSNNPELAQNLLNLLSGSGTVSDVSFAVSHSHIHDSFIPIDIKNSLYAVSNRLNQLQRLFDKHILRAWNDQLLLGADSDNPPSLPSENLEQ